MLKNLIIMKHKNYLITEIKKIIKSELKIKVDEKSKIYDHIKWDSLGNFNILLACERKFKIKFSNSEFSKINSVKEIIKVIQKKMANKNILNLFKKLRLKKNDNILIHSNMGVCTNLKERVHWKIFVKVFFIIKKLYWPKRNGFNTSL